MNIEILQLIEGAKRASGLTVVIDVFRAFTVACYVMKNNALRLIPVNSLEKARDLKIRYPEVILIGERNEQKPEGFDFGNSPSEIITRDFSGKTVVHTTTAGTNGLVNAVNADKLITGSFVNIEAIVRYIKREAPEKVSLVCMGFRAETPTDEDTFCAEMIRAKLLGQAYDLSSKIEILKSGVGRRFFLPEKQYYSPSEDFYLCTQPGIFDFVLEATDNGGEIELKKVIV